MGLFNLLRTLGGVGAYGCLAAAVLPLAFAGSAHADDPADWRSPPFELLFAGAPANQFQPHSAHGGDFDSHARFEEGVLLVEVPAGAAWGKVGLFSPDPVIWLDDFGGEAEVRVTMTVDPARTSGLAFILAMPGWGGMPGDDPGWPSVRFYWTRYADGSGALAELHVDPHNQGDFWQEEVGPQSPAGIALVLRPGTVALEIDGRERHRRQWGVPGEGTGLRLYAFSHPNQANQPVTLALEEIRVERVYGGLRQEPLEGVAPLPSKLLFEGAPTPAWEPAEAVGGNFQSYARYEGGALIVDVPEGSHWGKTGLLSAVPLLTLDRRAERSAVRMTIVVDPDRTSNFVVALANQKVAEMWSDHVAWFVFGWRPETDDYVMGLQVSPWRDWSRTVKRARLPDEWDGHLVLDIGVGWAAIRIPGGPSVRGDTPTAVGRPYHATVLAHAPAYDLPTRLALSRVEVGIAPPPGMSAVERWHLVDEADFDPAIFLEDLAAEAWWPAAEE